MINVQKKVRDMSVDVVSIFLFLSSRECILKECAAEEFKEAGIKFSKPYMQNTEVDKTNTADFINAMCIILRIFSTSKIIEILIKRRENSTPGRRNRLDSPRARKVTVPTRLQLKRKVKKVKAKAYKWL